MSQLNWRHDIQGLRGIAVLAVLFYHLDMPGFSGGYVGVDIFFVISGYLITGLLIKEVHINGRVNYAYFFVRRIRRLAPALAAMVIGTCLVCFVVYAPTDQITLAKTAGFASAYLSNFWFSHLTTDYLAGNADSNPFLHTWSLGVEEQFYLVWPFVISVVGGCFVNKTRVLLGVFASVFAISFALCLYQTGAGQTYYSFFLLPARAWEFALGALCFLITKQFPNGKSNVNSCWLAALSWFGIGLVGLGVFAFSDETPYPSVFTLLPVLGTGILLCNQRDGTGGLLTGPLMLRIGAVSYSLYLWHWPVIVIGRHLFPTGGLIFGSSQISVKGGGDRMA